MGGGGRHHLVFDKVEDSINRRFAKAYVGQMVTAGVTYNIQDVFEMEGYFEVKVTPLGVRVCLLEEIGDGEVLHNLVGSGASWLNKWFVEVRRWEPGAVDDERVMWVKVVWHSLSCLQ